MSEIQETVNLLKQTHAHKLVHLFSWLVQSRMEDVSNIVQLVILCQSDPLQVGRRYLPTCFQVEPL